MPPRNVNVPPNNREVELATLASMMFHPECARVASDLKVECFSPVHQKAFEGLREQYRMSQSCDEYVLAAQLEFEGYSKTGAQSLAQTIATTNCTPSQIDEYCRILNAEHVNRQTQLIAQKLFQGAPLTEVREKIDALDANEELTKAADIEIMDQQIEDEISGARYAVEFPDWPALSNTQCLLPGTISLLCGSPGVSKSFFVTEPTWRWAIEKQDNALLACERGAEYHIRRACAQMAGNSKILKPKWVKLNPNDAVQIWDAQRERMKFLRDFIQAPHPKRRIDCEMFLDWMRRECRSGKRVLIIDPVSIMQGRERRYIDHEDFVSEARKIVTQYKASLLCVTHPRKGKPGEIIVPCLENIPGSSFWERFSDSIFWLSWHLREEALFKCSMGVVTQHFNRTLHCLKIRDDERPGKIGYYFDGATLCHTERGVIDEGTDDE